MTGDEATEPLAVVRRRESRREEWSEQTKLAELLARHLDPSSTFWTSLENKPLSALSGMLQRRRGVKSGLPDLLVIACGKPIFVELKSRRGVASEAQKQVRAEMLPAGAEWWLARTARAAMMALQLSGVVFRRSWKPPRLAPWEGPFADPTVPLPQHPRVKEERRLAQKRWRERHKAARVAQAEAATEVARDDAGSIAA